MQDAFRYIFNCILSNLYVNQHKICCYGCYDVIQYRALVIYEYFKENRLAVLLLELFGYCDIFLMELFLL